jgi:ABC-type dipeptide/oligopeptide/nickel transport system ATPase subunit
VTGHLLRAEGITVRYGDRAVLRGVDVTVRTGSPLGVVGPSGCGKTTLLRVLAGLTRPHAGTVTYDGDTTPPPGSVALLAQHPRTVCNPRWRLERIMAEPAAIRGSSAGVADLAARVGLDGDLLTRFPAQVSDGQLQRACLARVLLQQPRYLLCDEPTAMLDPIAAGEISLLLKQLAAETAMVVVSHSPALVNWLTDTVLDLECAEERRR